MNDIMNYNFGLDKLAPINGKAAIRDLAAFRL